MMADYSLHKQLYDLSGLDDESLMVMGRDCIPYMLFSRDYLKTEDITVAYTTDYLLEVLQSDIKVEHNLPDYLKKTTGYITLEWLGGEWSASYDAPSVDKRYFEQKADTPLEALLKLAIRLIQDGVWSPKDE